MRRSSVPLRAGVVAACLLVAGCGTEPETPPPPAAPVEPAADSPQGVIRRLVWAYENRRIAEYEDMFTEDFLFYFSDVEGDYRFSWPGGWTKADEATAARHLFFGGVNLNRFRMVAASSIDVDLPIRFFQSDRDHPDTTFWKVLVSRPLGTVVLPSGDPYDPTVVRFSITSVHRLSLVRGDSAALAEHQPADSTRWYVRMWRDETTDVPPGQSTWGMLKGPYR